MKMNKRKTEVIVFGDDTGKKEYAISSCDIEQVRLERFKHLSSRVSMAGGDSQYR